MKNLGMALALFFQTKSCQIFFRRRVVHGHFKWFCKDLLPLTSFASGYYSVNMKMNNGIEYLKITWSHVCHCSQLR